jgi:hypothetical protein
MCAVEGKRAILEPDPNPKPRFRCRTAFLFRTPQKRPHRMTKASGTAEARGSSPDITAGIDVEWSDGTK